jgi:hypothetical protein
MENSQEKRFWDGYARFHMGSRHETRLVRCACCDTEYPYEDEPKEVKEGGQHICPECWEEDDGHYPDVDR